MNMLYFDQDAFESQTTNHLNSTITTEGGQTLSLNQIHTYSIDQNKRIVKFDILPMDSSDNFNGKDFERDHAIAMARLFEKNQVQYNFSGILPKYEVRLLQVRELGNTATFVEKSDSKSSDPFKSEPERSIIITLLCIAGVSVLGFALWLLTRTSPQFGQFPGQFGSMGMGGGMMFGGPMSPQGGPMGPMGGPMSPHLGGVNPMSPGSPYGNAMAPAGMQGGAGGGWGAVRNTFGAANAFGTAGKLYGLGGQQGQDMVNPSFMQQQQQQQQQKAAAFSPRFYTGGQGP